MNKIICYSILILLISSCRPKLTQKDLMNAFTIGWHKGYNEGQWHQVTSEEIKKWSRSRFIQDSCIFYLEYHKIFEMLPKK